MMRKLFVLLLTCMTCMVGLAQSLMILPSELWMKENGFADEKEVDSVKVPVYRYADALLNNRDMSVVLSFVQKAFEGRGFKVVSQETIIKSLGANESINSILNHERPDFLVFADYSIKEKGPAKDLSCSLKALDAYTYDNITRMDASRERCIGPIELSLQAMLLGEIDEFFQDVFNYMIDLRNNGRKINVRFIAAEGSGIDFQNSEVNGQILKDYLYEWLKGHAINKSLQLGLQEAALCAFRDVCIPLFNNNGEPIEYELWASGVLKKLREDSGLKIKRSDDASLGTVSFIIGTD